ncbi:regulatory iron-sulfur-containing complex subunit RicT [Desulfovibrio sp.]|uniref:PSP1 domain-containing protein n=1 Tax=Desulfovibrio sp. TaxID=885 RepID=UPI0025B931BB|nr:regulatory iron-sulfur-containing complex subunit RicT [Desulfovibrio sp.]
MLIEAEQGQTLAEIVSGPAEHLPGQMEQELPSILRHAGSEDIHRGEANEQMAREAQEFCRQCIRDRDLDMKLVDVEVFFDRSKLIFYFTAPSRIDFRDLVKDLVREYRARIELRQIGVRHETQMVGAVGNCGMVCCCRRYLRKFAPVTIRMAKEQNLFLNPAKISGICGRLLCCLSYEQDNYDHFHRMCPRLGKKYQTDKGPMKVLRANMFRNSLSVLTENNEEVELSLDDWQALSPHRPEAPQGTQQKQPPKGPVGDSLLVVSATPDTLDSLDFMDEFRQDERDAQADESAAEPGERGAGAEAQAEPGKSRRKRRRKSQRPDHE